MPGFPKSSQDSLQVPPENLVYKVISHLTETNAQTCFVILSFPFEILIVCPGVVWLVNPPLNLRIVKVSSVWLAEPKLSFQIIQLFLNSLKRLQHRFTLHPTHPKLGRVSKNCAE